MQSLVTIETPPHAQRLLLPHLIHEVDPPVALRAADPPGHMDAVIEVDVVGELMNPHPLHRLARLPARPDRSQHLGIGANQLVAIHARLGGRNHGDGRPLHVDVAIPAIQTELVHMEPMRVRDRLIGRVAHLGEPGRKVVPDEKGSRDKAQRRGHPCDEGQRVCGSRKNLHGQSWVDARPRLPHDTSLMVRSDLRPKGIRTLEPQQQEEESEGIAYTRPDQSRQPAGWRKICAKERPRGPFAGPWPRHLESGHK